MLSALPRARAVLVAGALAASVLLSGCTSNPTDPRDPLEPMNRVFFTFNRAVDATMIKPAAELYRWAIPQVIRTAFTNVIENTRDIWRIVNSLLQGDVSRAGDYFGRIVVNTTAGVLGIFDAATELGIKGGPNDLGMTFAKWGIGDGPFLVVPLFGPATVRDGIGIGIETWYDPLQRALHHWSTSGWEWGVFTVRYINARSRLLDTDKLIEDALDPYAFQRDSYFQFRRSLYSPTGKTDGEGEDRDDSARPENGPSTKAPTDLAPAAEATSDERPEPHRTSAADIEEPAAGTAPAI